MRMKSRVARVFLSAVLFSLLHGGAAWGAFRAPSRCGMSRRQTPARLRRDRAFPASD